MNIEENKSSTNSTIDSDNLKIEKAETVEVKKTELEGLLARIEKLEKGGIDKPSRVQNDIAYVRLFEEKIVTSIQKTWTEPKESKRNGYDEARLYALIKTEDDKEFTIDFVDFLESSKMLRGSITKINKKDASRNMGVVNAENPDPRNDKNFESFKVDLIEKKTDDSFMLEIMEGDRAGEKINIHNSVINL